MEMKTYPALYSTKCPAYIKIAIWGKCSLPLSHTKSSASLMKYLTSEKALQTKP